MGNAASTQAVEVFLSAARDGNAEKVYEAYVKTNIDYVARNPCKPTSETFVELISSASSDSQYYML